MVRRTRGSTAQEGSEGAKAMAEYKAEQEAVREKTARLRALRLARDTANQTKIPGVANSGSQADWIA
jgi:hypothetical protein